MAQYSGIFTTTQQMQAVAATTWTAGPGAPTSVTATAGSASASVAFTAPTNTGTPPGISSYIVTSSPGGITASGSSSPITVSGLTNGTAYTFTVQAIGTYSGPGAISAASNSVTPSPPYIEDVFSTYLYTGNGTNGRSITNNIDLSTKGGMVWIKCRSNAFNHCINDTARGANNSLSSNLSDAADTTTDAFVTAFNSNGFNIGSNAYTNANTATYTSWTFAKQAKFFDVVTYTGNGVVGREISHNLGSAPGCIIIKAYSGANAEVKPWAVYHRILGAGNEIFLNTTGAYESNTLFPANPTSTVFSVNGDSPVNGNGLTYVAYLFAHNAGGFGAAGTDNVITCGGFSGSATVNLGYEPQWVLTKRSDSTGSWYLIDNMRGFTAPDGASGNNSNYLFANTTAAESSYNLFSTTSTGFSATGATGSYIYIAIRRGPMKTPTTGTSVFSPVAYTASSGPYTVNAGFPTDMAIASYTISSGNSRATSDRLRGSNNILQTFSTNAEVNISGWAGYNSSMSGVVVDNGSSWTNGNNYIWWNFRRAPGFFDEVCYTGTGSNTTQNHNLGVAPELMIIKKRSGASNWVVYAATLGAVPLLSLNNNSSKSNEATYLNSTAPTASVFSIGTASETNSSGSTYVAYLFATCTGVSKVGSYTGNGSSQTINCGFTGGARFVMIKRTNDTGDWYVWDTARGMVAGTDPFLRLNETYSENNTNSVYTVTTGFQVVTTDAEMNASGSNYIYLAIA